MSYTKRKVESLLLNSTSLQERILRIEKKINTLEEFINDLIKEKGIR